MLTCVGGCDLKRHGQHYHENVWTQVERNGRPTVHEAAPVGAQRRTVAFASKPDVEEDGSAR